MQSGLAASEERVRLETYLDKMIKDGLALIDEYTSRDGLARRLENLLAAQAKKAAADVPSAGINEQELDRLLEDGYRLSAASDATSAVWPTTEYDQRLATTQFGTRTLTFWYLVITNKTGRPVRKVRFRYVTPDGEPDQSFHVGDPQEQPIAFMPPDGKARFQIDQGPNSSTASLCVVTWEDELGEHETPPTTVRTV
jgi:hypothetical protein